MILIVGLGNPGKKFKKTRHNVGFMTVDNLQLTIDNFSNWENIKKIQAEISKGEINGQKILLAKPLTFMNFSGKSVYLLVKNFLSKKLINSAMTELLSRNLWVVHDDIDLPLGKIRISIGRGSAGHKGVESIIKELGAKNFVRFRIGVALNSKIKNRVSIYGSEGEEKSEEDKSLSSSFACRPENEVLFAHQNSKSQTKIQNFVLGKFTKEEKKILKEVIEKTIETIGFSLKEGLEKAMSKYNQ